MTLQNHILIVEDDPVACATLSAYLGKEGFRISTAHDGNSMREIFAKGDVDLILLDISLPGEDGFSLLRELRRRSEVGVIMVTGKSEDVDRIVALEMGADDYVMKPFNMRELFARTKNLMRRTHAVRLVRKDEPVFRFAGWTINTLRRTLTSPKDEDIHVTRIEFDILDSLARNPGRVFTRKNLIDRVSSHDHDVSERTIDVLIGRLRSKIELTPKDPKIILTVHAVGYVMAA